jgi:two-component system nitrogen regulation response regulator NtrX
MKILIIDDEKNIRTSLSSVLRDEGHEVFLAEDGKSGLVRLTEQAVELVFLDVKLPGMDGLQVLQRLQQEFPDVDVLMISGNSDIETAVKAVRMGAYDFMEKPLSLPKILIAVKNIVDKRQLAQKYFQGLQQNDVRYRIVGESPQINSVREIIQRVSQTDAKVLITGESGTGKELVAYAIHKLSNRRLESFVTFNSAAIPKELVESELFGYEKGAFTGAVKTKPGRLELAHHGTLFLDEIGDMQLDAQVKILRVIEEHCFERVGSNRTIQVDVRIIAATHQDLAVMVQEGRFREDLYFRLNVLPIQLPSLRSRTGDIPLLLEYYLAYFARELATTPKHFSLEALALLREYPFPGNIRELKNLVERLYILAEGAEISEEEVRRNLCPRTTRPPAEQDLLGQENFGAARRAFEKFYLTEKLRETGWSVSRTAENIGMQQPNLSRKLKELDIQLP